MTATHRCDYCGFRYFLPIERDIVSCEECGESRIYNLRENRPSLNYSHPNAPPEKVIAPEPETGAEDEKRRTKKQSKDIKTKRTSQEYSEKVRSRNGWKRG